MTYLRICDVDDAEPVKARAFQRLARALRAYAEATEQWDAIEPHCIDYQRGQCRVHCEYDTVYFRIDDVSLAAYIASRDDFHGCFRRPEMVRLFAVA